MECSQSPASVVCLWDRSLGQEWRFRKGRTRNQDPALVRQLRSNWPLLQEPPGAVQGFTCQRPPGVDMQEQLRRGFWWVILPAGCKIRRPEVNAVVIEGIRHLEFRGPVVRGETPDGQGDEAVSLLQDVKVNAGWKSLRSCRCASASSPLRSASFTLPVLFSKASFHRDAQVSIMMMISHL